MAALLEGQSISHVSKEYRIPRGTVAGWSAGLRKEGVSGVSDEKRKEIGELLVEYLRANLNALRSQAEVFTDRDWLLKQGASEAATLHGVMTDKAVRLIEAFGEPE